MAADVRAASSAAAGRERKHEAASAADRLAYTLFCEFSYIVAQCTWCNSCITAASACVSDDHSAALHGVDAATRAAATHGHSHGSQHRLHRAVAQSSGHLDAGCSRWWWRCRVGSLWSWHGSTASVGGGAWHASSPLYWRTSCRWGRGIWWDAGDADGWLWWNTRYANGWLWCNTGNANGWRWNARDANGWRWNAWNANGWHDARALYDRDGGDGRHAWRHAHCGRRAYVRQRTACSLPRRDGGRRHEHEHVWSCLPTANAAADASANEPSASATHPDTASTKPDTSAPATAPAASAAAACSARSSKYVCYWLCPWYGISAPTGCCGSSGSGGKSNWWHWWHAHASCYAGYDSKSDSTANGSKWHAFLWRNARAHDCEW
mmetsp:Transcript_25462/g.41027  ORF Transcript_25462/g.41027 Transcript_25462/m.41027 type:complete len:379 (-) Transcript_25462:2121-3257(-)